MVNQERFTSPEIITRPILLNSLDIELTERCNNNCIHCSINLPINDHHAQAREMTTEQAKRVLFEAAAVGVESVRFTGGEPLIRPDFVELYRFARRLGLRVTLLTNARLITPRLARLFTEIPPLEPLVITIYGMHPESYDAVTDVPGSFEGFWQGIQNLRQFEVPFIVRFAVLPPNQHEVEEYNRWAASLPSMRGHLPGYVLFLELRARRDDPEKNALIESLRIKPKDAVTFMDRHMPHYHESMREFAENLLRKPLGDRLFTCGIGKKPCVDAYGCIQACLSLRAPELALPPGTSIKRAVEEFQAFNTLRATHPEYLRRCAQCLLKAMCDQCPPKSWSETGALDIPVDYYCSVAHEHARFLGWLEQDQYGWSISPQDWRQGMTGK